MRITFRSSPHYKLSLLVFNFARNVCFIGLEIIVFITLELGVWYKYEEETFISLPRDKSWCVVMYSTTVINGSLGVIIGYDLTFLPQKYGP